MLETLRELMARRPFVPFRLILSSGDRYEVRHPEFAWLVQGGVYVGLPSEKPHRRADLPARTVFCSLLHLTSVETVVGA